MKTYEANISQRVIVSFLWTFGFITLILGKRLIHMMKEPNDTIPWFLYLIAIVGPLGLYFLPRLFTAVVVTIEDQTITLRSLFGASRVYNRILTRVKISNKNVIHLEGVSNGKHKQSFIFSTGFSQQTWQELNTEIMEPSPVQDASRPGVPMKKPQIMKPQPPTKHVASKPDESIDKVD